MARAVVPGAKIRAVQLNHSVRLVIERLDAGISMGVDLRVAEAQQLLVDIAGALAHEHAVAALSAAADNLQNP